MAWRETTWLGRRVAKAPTDLFVYQEIIAAGRGPIGSSRPAPANGGRALVPRVDLRAPRSRPGHLDRPEVADERAEHPRITYLEGSPQSDEISQRVREMVGESPQSLVVLGSQPGTNLRMEAEFKAYAPLVPVGSYVIVEYTILNGHPVWPGFGPGPERGGQAHPRRQQQLGASTPTLEKYALTFNPGGFLKRLR